MTMPTLPEARLQLASLAIFRGLLRNPVVEAFIKLAWADNLPAQVDAYGCFCGLLMAQGNNWSQYLLQCVLRDDNFYVRQKAREQAFDEHVENAVRQELAALQAISQLSAQQVADQLNCGFPLPVWQTSKLDFFAQFAERTQNIKQAGYGIFSEFYAFTVGHDELVPVKYPDAIKLEHLTGYQHERQQVLSNTLALLNGRPAANVLLYGDSGTGKSTTVKAMANELKDKGLRLIELRKDQLPRIPWLIEQLTGNPLKFIIFIDDLSFTQHSEQFSALKAILEGSVFAKTSNMAIYATSNRRHLVRERFSDRDGDEVHARDTLEELSSLSERFGLVITFLRPGRDLYWSIVEQYLTSFALPFNADMRRKAEAFALERGGRSARVARQFVENLLATGATASKS